MYYEHLGQIFWKSENYLFHAFASLKNVFFVKVTPLGDLGLQAAVAWLKAVTVYSNCMGLEDFGPLPCDGGRWGTHERLG